MFEVGERVAIHPATTAWMRGDRYGVYKGRTRTLLHDTQVPGVRILLDKSKREVTFHPDNVMALRD